MCTVNACSRLTAFISFGTAGGAMPTVPRLIVASLTFLPLREGVDGDGVRAASRVSRRGESHFIAIMRQLCGSCVCVICAADVCVVKMVGVRSRACSCPKTDQIMGMTGSRKEMAGPMKRSVTRM